MTTDSIPNADRSPDPNANEITRRWGAVAMVDALGFKGIWKRFDPVLVAQKMQHMRNEVALFRDVRNESSRAMSGAVQIVAQAFSDSFILGCSFDVEQHKNFPAEFGKLWLLNLTCGAAGYLIRLGLEGEPHLAFRGCISVGDVWVTKNVILGEAVETAAASYEKAEAAVVWLTPEALRTANEPLPREGFVTLPSRRFTGIVPLKNGEMRQTQVVDACLGERVEGKLAGDTYEKRLWATFATSGADRSLLSDIERKRKNTEVILAGKSQ